MKARKETLYKNPDGEVRTEDEWLWVISNNPMRNGTLVDVPKHPMTDKEVA